MKATGTSPRSGQRTANNAVVLLHARQLECNLARSTLRVPGVTLGLAVDKHFPWACAPGSRAVLQAAKRHIDLHVRHAHHE
jgi:hypothetical protein